MVRVFLFCRFVEINIKMKLQQAYLYKPFNGIEEVFIWRRDKLFTFYIQKSIKFIKQ